MTAEEAFERAKEMIAEAIEAGATELRDFPAALEALPEEIGQAEALRLLNIGGTQVADLGPIAGMDWLTRLDADRTPVADLTPLVGLTGLEKLYLQHTQVSDLSALSGAAGLWRLWLNNTQVSDLSALSGAAGLQALSLDNTPVSDLSALSGAAGLERLYLTNTQVSDLSALSGAAGLYVLRLGGTPVGDLRPIAHLSFEEPQDGGRWLPGIWFEGSRVTGLDPELKRLSEVGNRAARLAETLAYLRGLEPGGDDVEQAVAGPVLVDALSDIAWIEKAFDAVPVDPAPKMPDAGYDELKEALGYISRVLGGAGRTNPMGEAIAKAFRDYCWQVESAEPNGRILNFIGETVKAAFADEFNQEALGEFEKTSVAQFLAEHEAFVGAYFAQSRRPVTALPDLEAEELVAKLPAEVSAVGGYIDAQIAAGVFADGVKAPVGLIEERVAGAQKVLATEVDAGKREAATTVLRRAAVLLTAHVGRIRARLIQFGRDAKLHKDATEAWAKDNPVSASANATFLMDLVLRATQASAPIFARLWQWIGSLPLPF